MRTAAGVAGKAFITIASPSAQRALLPHLFDAMEVKRNWQTKVGALQLLDAWSKIASTEVALSLPEIIPVASGCLADAKPQVGSRHPCSAFRTSLPSTYAHLDKHLPAGQERGHQGVDLRVCRHGQQGH